MAIDLRQSTASQEIPLGYFLDSTDGDTEETALTIANTDIKLWKTGATTLASKNLGGATHISNGIYHTTLDATDTDTLGPMTVFVHVTGALSVKVECTVLSADVYDSKYYSGTGADPMRGIMDAGTAQSATSTTLVLRAAASFGDDNPIGATIYIKSATAGTGQRRVITDYVSATDTATVDTWDTTPTGTIEYIVYSSAPGSTSSPPAVNVTQISGDATAADNLELDYDGTGYAKANSTIGTCTTNTDMRGTDSALLAASAPANFGDLSISATTGLVDVTQAAADKVWSTATRALTDKAGFTISGTKTTLDALNDLSSANVLTTALTESYNTDGSAPTVTQALMGIYQMLTEKAVSGTTVTVKKLDGTTTAMTLTLDDGTSPTSITRAT